MKNLKPFLVVFVVAFAANVLASWAVDRAFPGSSWRWDTSTATAGTVALVLTWLLRRKSSGSISVANAARAREHIKVLARVRALFDARGEVSNDDVQHALGVSDATATNYLSELESVGDIVQVGTVGRGVAYRLK